jgi:hypothetical protein
MSWLGGIPAARGAAWGLNVSARMRGDRAKWPQWPAFDGKVKRIAYGKVAGLQQDLIDRFARTCYEAARDAYERGRAGTATPPGQPAFHVGENSRKQSR